MISLVFLLCTALCAGQTVIEAEVTLPLGLQYGPVGIPTSCCPQTSKLVGTLSSGDKWWNLTIPAAVDCNGNIQQQQSFKVTETGNTDECSFGTLEYQNEHGSGQSQRVVVAEDGALGTYTTWFFPWQPNVNCSLIYGVGGPSLDKCTMNASYAHILQPITYVTHASKEQLSSIQIK
jgi:hypothetical protein